MDTEELALSILYDEILNFQLLRIPSETRFWMIRTKKGYFYHEFIANNYVALAWNTLTEQTSFSAATADALGQTIMSDYHEIKRPTLVINKCRSFIFDIKPGDILVIPSESSKYVTFAYAGTYYEEPEKDYELEIETISKIENKDVLIDEISCPYKKRRKIVPIRTIPGDEINFHLFKTISSYHGITNLDSSAELILDHLYNCYSYNNTTRLVFHVGKTGQITSREFSGLLYSINSILCAPNIDEMAVSTQATVHSVGDVVFAIKEIYSWFTSNYIIFIAIAVILGGGKFFTSELPGIAKIIKDFQSIKDEKRKSNAEITKLELDNIEKAIEIQQRMKECGVDPKTLFTSIGILSDCRDSMQIRPIETLPAPISNIEDESSETDDEEQEV